MATTERLLCILALHLLLHSLRAEQTGVYSLCYNFSVVLNPRPGQLRYEVLGQVDNKIFLYYNNGNDKFKPLGPLGKKVNATKAWGYQVEALRDIRDQLSQQLLHIKTEADTRDPLILQGKMSCQSDGNGYTHGFWDIGLNGQRMLHFDSDNRKWTEVQPGSSWMKEKWENDKDVTQFLYRTLMGDCLIWLQKFLVHWEEMLEPTAPSSTTSDVAQRKSTTVISGPCLLLVTLTGSILLGI